MVVVVSEPSTSASQKKNRRKISKKIPRTASADEPAEDDAMDDASTQDVAVPVQAHAEDDDDVMIDTDPSLTAPIEAPEFPPAPANAGEGGIKSETRRVPIPPHRMTPLKKDWINIFGPLTEILGLQVRMNVQRKCVEVRVSISSDACRSCS